MNHSLLSSIQSLRAAAALSVMMLHVGFDAAAYSGVEDLKDITRVGGVGVDLFFVISGFIMLLISNTRDRPAHVFLLDRFARIIPLYWTATAVLMVLSLFSRTLLPPSLRDVFLSALMVPYEDGPVLKVGWTLNYEWFFYILLAIAFVSRRNSTLLVTVLLVTSVAAGMIIEPAGTVFATFTDPLMLEFVAGLWIGTIWLHGQKPHPFVGTTFLLLSAALLMSWSLSASDPPHGFERLAFWGLPAALCVVGAIQFERFRFVRTRAALALGAASFSLYLSHPLVLVVLGRVWRTLGVTGAPTLVGASVAICICTGLICHHWIEKPLIVFVKSALGLTKGRCSRVV